MIVTEKYIRDLRGKSLLNITVDMKKFILKKFSKDLKPNDSGKINNYTDQDVWEQIRKIIKNK
ncbi:hypothetical protein [Clostridium sp.]